MTDRPAMLEGLRVLDCSRVIAGPYSAMLMGDLGADVIKLERPGRGDDFRAIRGEGGMSAAFAAVNRSKRGIAVDLAHPEGRRVAFELARRADVLIENFLPGVVERQGLGYAAVSAANPGIVYASVTGFGQDGPLARRPGYNLIAQGMAGIMALTGHPGDPPTRAGGSIADLAASFLTFGMVQAALVHRARTGRGQHLDVNLLASTIAMLPDPVAHYFDSGKRPRREGNRNPNLTPAEAYRTGDGYLNVVLLSPDQWERFCGVLGDEVLRTALRHQSGATRQLRGDEGAGGDGARGRVHRRVGGALREGANRGGSDLRVRRGVRGSAGPPPGNSGGDGAAGLRHRPHGGLPGSRQWHARAHHSARAAPGTAHRRGAGRARPRPRGDRPPGLTGRHRAGQAALS